MAQSYPGIAFEDVPLEEARRMGRGPRMDPVIYDALARKIQSLSTNAVRLRFDPEVSVATMKNRIVRVARELKVPVTIRRVPDGLLFWRSTDEDVAMAKETAARLQTGQRQRRGGRRRRRRG